MLHASSASGSRATPSSSTNSATLSGRPSRSSAATSSAVQIMETWRSWGRVALIMGGAIALNVPGKSVCPGGVPIDVFEHLALRLAANLLVAG